MKPRDARPTKPVAGNAAARDLDCTIGQVCVNLTGLSTPYGASSCSSWRARSSTHGVLGRVSDALATAERRSREAA